MRMRSSELENSTVFDGEELSRTVTGGVASVSFCDQNSISTLWGLSWKLSESPNSL